MSDELVRVMYISRAQSPMTPEELAELLEGSRRRNIESGVTGLLLYDSGYFAQVIEGPADAVYGLLARISRDPRHTAYFLLSRGEVSERYFEGWSMDWANLDQYDRRRHAKLRAYLREHTVADRSKIYGALVAFIDEHRRERPVA